MTRSTSDVIEPYLAALRAELAGAGAADTDELVAEVRSLLTDAANGDPARAAAEITRSGDPADLARGILAERGLDSSKGMPSGVWWRLGIAAPIDIAVGLALPLAAVLPLYVIAWFGQPRAAGIAAAVALGTVVLAWPFLIWRPWRRGGRVLSPGMTLTDLAVVRAPGSWRLVRTAELAPMGLAPRRNVGLAIVATLVAAVLLASTAIVGLGLGRGWLASAVMRMGSSTDADEGVALETELQVLVEQVYADLRGTQGSAVGRMAARHVTADALAGLESLGDRIASQGITEVRIGAPAQVSPGVYRVEVEGQLGAAPGGGQVGSSTFTVGRRQWLTEEGVASDWAVVAITVGSAP